MVKYLFILYKITNQLNKKIYVGIHKTQNINDGYYGSGKLIQAAIKKYGKENFVKEILYICDSLEEIIALEREIVNEEFVSRKDTYNISLGGGIGGKDINGFTFANRMHTADSRVKMSNARKGKKINISDEGKQRIIESNKLPERCAKISKTMTGKPKTDEHKNNIRKSAHNK
jgi:hypothetical protein